MSVSDFYTANLLFNNDSVLSQGSCYCVLFELNIQLPLLHHFSLTESMQQGKRKVVTVNPDTY